MMVIGIVNSRTQFFVCFVEMFGVWVPTMKKHALCDTFFKIMIQIMGT